MVNNKLCIRPSELGCNAGRLSDLIDKLLIYKIYKDNTKFTFIVKIIKNQ
jgi:hypothetical protein